MAHPYRSIPARAGAALCALSAVLGASAPAGSAQTTYLKDATGTWKPWKMTISSGARTATAATAAELKAFEAHLVAFRELLRQVPSVATPAGYSVEVWGHLRAQPGRDRGPASATLPIAGGVSFGAFSIYEVDRGGKRVRIDTGETALLQFAVNDMSPQTIGKPGPPEWHVFEHDVIVQPPATGERAGFPRYDEIIVITRRTAPLWAPVPLLEAWQLELRAATHALAEARQTAARVDQALAEQLEPARKAAREADYRKRAAAMPDPAAFLAQMTDVERMRDKVAADDAAPAGAAKRRLRDATQAVAAMEGIIAGLSAEARTAAACWATDATRLEDRFRGEPDVRCRALVRPNPAFFDRSLPRSTPQLLLIQDAKRCYEDLRDPDVLRRLPGNCAANRGLLESWNTRAVLDWLR